MLHKIPRPDTNYSWQTSLTSGSKLKICFMKTRIVKQNLSKLTKCKLFFKYFTVSPESPWFALNINLKDKFLLSAGSEGKLKHQIFQKSMKMRNYESAAWEGKFDKN